MCAGEGTYFCTSLCKDKWNAFFNDENDHVDTAEHAVDPLGQGWIEREDIDSDRECLPAAAARLLPATAGQARPTEAAASTTPPLPTPTDPLPPPPAEAPPPPPWTAELPTEPPPPPLQSTEHLPPLPPTETSPLPPLPPADDEAPPPPPTTETPTETPGHAPAPAPPAANDNDDSAAAAPATAFDNGAFAGAGAGAEVTTPTPGDECTALVIHRPPAFTSPLASSSAGSIQLSMCPSATHSASKAATQPAGAGAAGAAGAPGVASGGGNEDVELEVPARYARVQNGAHGPGVVISRIKKPPQLLVATDLLTWYRVDGSEEMRMLSPAPVCLFTAPVVRNVVRQTRGDNKLIVGYLLGPMYSHNDLSIYSTYAPGDVSLTFGAPEASTPGTGRITRGAAGAAYQPMHGDSELPKLKPGDTFKVMSAGAALDASVGEVEVPPGAAVFLGIMTGVRKSQMDKYILYAAFDDAKKPQRAVCFWSSFAAAAGGPGPPVVDVVALARTAFDSVLLKSRSAEAVQKATERAASRWATRAMEEEVAPVVDDKELMETFINE